MDAGDLEVLSNGFEDGTPLVFLHGYSDMADCWLGLIERLGMAMPVHALDAPGHGYSPFHAGSGFLEQLMERSARFLASLGRPSIVIGHSLGAVQALALAGEVPHLVRGVVLEDPPIGPDLSQWADPAFIHGMAEDIRRVQAQPVDAILARVREAHPAWDPIEFEPMVRSTLLFDPRVAEVVRIHPDTGELLLRRSTCPTLLLTGDPAHGAIIDADTVAWATALRPDLQVVHHPGAGHQVHRDAAEAVADTIRAFIGVWA